MKKILIVDIGRAYGGIEKFVYNIYKFLDKDVYSIDFLVYNTKCAYENEFIKFGRVFHVPGRKDNPFAFHKAIKNFFADHDFDVVWIQTCSASNIYTHKIVKKYTSATLITHAHVAKAESKSLFYDIVTSLLHRMHKRTLNRLTDIPLACSVEAAKYLFGEKRGCRTQIIYNGIELSQYQLSGADKKKTRQMWGINDDEFVVGHIGRFSKVKNQTFVVEIFNSIHSKMKNSKLLLVGDGETRKEVEQKVHNYHLDNYVIFTGERQDVPSLLGGMDVFVFPSVNEGFGIAAIEAQAAKIPTVISASLSDELIVSNFCKKISLDADVSIWVSAIISLGDQKNLQLMQEIKKFDAKESARIMSDIFMGR